MFRVVADDQEPELVRSFWAAYWRADELRAAGARLVRVYPEGKSSPVFALTQRVERADGRAENTVDPGLWDAVMELTKGE